MPVGAVVLELPPVGDVVGVRVEVEGQVAGDKGVGRVGSDGAESGRAVGGGSGGTDPVAVPFGEGEGGAVVGDDFGGGGRRGCSVFGNPESLFRKTGQVTPHGEQILALPHPREERVGVHPERDGKVGAALGCAADTEEAPVGVARVGADGIEAGGGGGGDESRGVIVGAVAGVGRAEVERRTADFKVEPVGDVEESVAVVRHAGHAPRVVGGAEGIGDTGVGGVRGDVGFEEVADGLDHELGMDGTGFAAGVPEEEDGFGVVDAGGFEGAGDAVSGLRVIGVDQRLVGNGRKDGVDGGDEGCGGVAEEVVLIVLPAPEVCGGGVDQVQAHEAGLLVDFAEACGRAAQGGVPEAAVVAVGKPADRIVEHPPLAGVHDCGEGGVADGDELFGKTVGDVERARAAALGIREIRHAVREGAEGVLVGGVGEIDFHTLLGGGMADVVQAAEVPVEERERVGAAPQEGGRVVQCLAGVEGVRIRGGLEADGAEPVSGAAETEFFHEARGIGHGAQIHLFGGKGVGHDILRGGGLVAEGLADHMGEFPGVGDGEPSDHDLGGEVDIAAVGAVRHLAVETVAVVVEGAVKAAVVDGVGGDFSGVGENLGDGNIEFPGGDEAVRAADEEKARAPLLVGVLQEGADAVGGVGSWVVGADPFG